MNLSLCVGRHSTTEGCERRLNGFFFNFNLRWRIFYSIYCYATSNIVKLCITNFSIYPNPVRPEYSGNIAISGLLNNSTVKITDISGTLINEIKSQGGQVLWDGNNFDGVRASTGVYLVFISGENDSQKLQTEVVKIMFIK